MAAKSKFQRAMRRFGPDRRGNYAIMTAVLAPLLLLGIGYGLNVAQMTSARSNLLAALDAAVTSTTRDISIGVITPQNVTPTVQAFLLANGARTFAQAERIRLDEVITDTFRKTVMAKASVEIDMAFPLFGAPGRQTVSAESAAMYSDRKIEVAMMLDVTGSMQATAAVKNRKGEVTKAATNKIGDLKAAAKDAVDALLSGNVHTADRVRVALVPYAAAVNVGALAASTIYEETKSSSVLPPANYTPPAKRRDNCATERKLEDGSADMSDDAPDMVRRNYKAKEDYKALVNRDFDLGSCPTASVIPLTTDKTALNTMIDGFKASGMTAGGIATQWTYYMLSPNWRSTISTAGLGAGPADRDPDKVAKIAILMTDGEYNEYYAGSSSANNARDLCTRMKRDGIEVFTIGFALSTSESAASRKILKDCASPDTALTRHFYDAASGAELKKAFQDIVRNIERLALIR